MTEAIDLLRAKSRKDDENLLLKNHIKLMLDKLQDIYKYVNDNKKNISNESLKDDEFFKNQILAIFLHDLGKIDYSFQKKMFSYEDRNKEEWKEINNFFGNTKEIRDINIHDHEMLSVIWSLFLMGEQESNKIRTSILLHHQNRFYNDFIHIFEVIREYENDFLIYLEFLKENRNKIEGLVNELKEYLIEAFREKGDFGELIRDVLNKKLLFNSTYLDRLIDMINNHNLDEIKEDVLFNFDFEGIVGDKEENKNEKKVKEIYDFFLFLGVFRRCDYGASAEVECLEPKDNAFKNLNQKIEENIKKSVNELWQKELIDKVKNEKNLVLIAPTGSGKTEFGLMWAKERGKKLIYTLPLRVALNDLFNRFGYKEENNVKKEGYFGKDVDILHSTSFIEYLESEKGKDSIDIKNKLESIKLMTSPVLLTTPDQIFLTSLKYYGSDKILSIYPESSIIIDEIQAYNEENSLNHDALRNCDLHSGGRGFKSPPVHI